MGQAVRKVGVGMCTNSCPLVQAYFFPLPTNTNSESSLGQSGWSEG